MRRRGRAKQKEGQGGKEWVSKGEGNWELNSRQLQMKGRETEWMKASKAAGGSAAETYSIQTSSATGDSQKTADRISTGWRPPSSLFFFSNIPFVSPWRSHKMMLGNFCTLAFRDRAGNEKTVPNRTTHERDELNWTEKYLVFTNGEVLESMTVTVKCLLTTSNL